MYQKSSKQNYTYKVSIIVPCYNTKPWLDECLQSLVDQTLEDIEIICVNDGSTDGTGKKLDEWQAQYHDKIKVIHQNNGGLSNARNAGMVIAQGECIGFVDSDDFVDSTMYEKLYKILKCKNADCAKCNFLSFNDGEYTKQQTKNSSSIETKALKEDIYTSIFKNGCFFTWGYLLKKNFLTTNGITFKDDIRYMEDYIFSYNIMECNPKVFKIEEQLYYYRKQRLGQLTSAKGKEVYDIFKVISCLYEKNKSTTNIKLSKNINNILLKIKIDYCLGVAIRINLICWLHFFYKYGYFLFEKEKIITIYKYVLSKKHKKKLKYILVPLFLIYLHLCYISQKILFNHDVK